MNKCDRECEKCGIDECLYKNGNYDNVEEFHEHMMECFGKHIVTSDELFFDRFKNKYKEYDDVIEFLNDKYFAIEENIEVDETCKTILKERIETVQKLIKNMKILGI